MLKCKVCGTAIESGSSVCSECGAKIERVRKAGTGKYKKNKPKGGQNRVRKDPPEDIFSMSNRSETESGSEPGRDLFSSEEAYEKARKGSVLEKIHVLEEEIGDTSQVIEEDPVIVPTVINRSTTNDIIRTSLPSRNPRDKKHDIPRRVIRSASSAKVTNASARSERRKPDADTAPENIAESESKRPSAAKPDERPAAMKTGSPVSKKSAKIEKTEAPAETERKAPEEELIAELNEVSNTTGVREIPADESVPEKPEPEKKEAEKEAPEASAPAAAPVNPPVRKKKKKKISADRPNAEETEKSSTEPPVKKKKKPAAAQSDGEQATVKKVKKIAKKPAQIEDITSGSEGAPESEKPADTPKKKKSKPAPDAEMISEEAAKKLVKKDKKPKPAKDTAVEEASSENDIPENPVVKSRDLGESKSVKEEHESKKPARFDEDDVNGNRFLAALAYIGILVLIPALKGGKSEFCRAHVKQGVRVLIWTLAVSLVTFGAVAGLRALLLWTLGLSFIVYKISMLVIVAVMLALVFVPVFEGAAGAFGGMYIKVPFVGVRRDNE